MKRRAFLRRMAFAALASAFIEVPRLAAAAPEPVTATEAIRRYQRVAVGNFTVKRPGAFDDLAESLFDQLWDEWAARQ